MTNNILPNCLQYRVSVGPKYDRETRRYNRMIATRRVFIANPLWVLANILLAKLGIMSPTFANMLNVLSFILTTGTVVQHNPAIGLWQNKLELGAVIISITLWINQLL